MKRLSAFFHICILILLMGAGLGLLREVQGQSLDVVEGDSTFRNFMLAAYLVSITPLLLKPLKTVNIVLKKPLIWILILLATVSVLWSTVPKLSFRRAGAIILLTLYAIALYKRYSFQEFLNLLGKALMILMVSSVLLALFKPGWGRMFLSGKDSWRGVFVHKNTLGLNSMIAILVFISLIQFDWKSVRKRLVWIIGLILSTVCLVKSSSLTSMLISFILVMGFLTLRIARSWNKVFLVFVIFSLMIFGSIGALIVQNSRVILNALGRDITLTGRIPLWETLIPVGMERFLGYGYDAFWLGWDGPSAKVWSSIWWQPTHSHNGFIDIWLELGWVGLILSSILLFKNLLGNLWSAILGDKEKKFWFLLFLCMVILNFSESILMGVNSIYWVLIVFGHYSFQTKKNLPHEVGES